MGRRARQKEGLDTELADLPQEIRWREWMGRVEAVIFASPEPVTREVLARVQSGAPLPELHLEPYETVFVEQVPKEEPPHILSDRVSPAPRIEMTVAQAPIVERTVFEEDPAPFGPSWTSPTGDANEMVSFRATVDLTLSGIGSAEVCVLCEGPPDVALSACSLAVDGVAAPVTTAASAGAFSATGRPVEEHWIWFMASVP